MRRRRRKVVWERAPRTGSPLGSDIVALLRRALRDEEYAAAEHLLKALEELERSAADDHARERRSRNVDIAYLEVARTLRPKPRIGAGGTSDVDSPSEHRRDKQ